MGSVLGALGVSSFSIGGADWKKRVKKENKRSLANERSQYVSKDYNEIWGEKLNEWLKPKRVYALREPLMAY